MSGEIEKWTVQQIKNKLQEMNVRIPTDKVMRKENYVDLLREAMQRSATPAALKISSRTTVKPSPEEFFTPVRELPRPAAKAEAVPVTPIQYRNIPASQHTDIFERMMKAKFSNRDIKEIETQGTKVKIDDIFLQIAILMLSILVGALVAHLFFGIFSSPIFCDTHQDVAEGCIPCPEHGICENGMLTCELPYVRQGNLCVKDEQILKNAYNMLEHVEEFVRENARDAYLTTKSVYETNSQELLKYLREKYAYIPNFDDTFREFHDMLKAGKSSILKIEENTGTLYISAKEGFLTLFDHLRIFLNENWLFLTTCLLILCALVFYILKKKQDFFLRSKAREMYISIKEQLRANVDESFEHGLPEDLLKSRMASLLGERASKIVWPYLEELRASDSNVCKFETVLGGRPKVMWQWKENVNPDAVGRMKIL